MPIDAVAARVREALARAESLFDSAVDMVADGHIADAARAHRHVAPRAAELSGELASTHGQAAAAAGDRLNQAATVDTRLAERLAEAARMHQAGAAEARGLRAGAAEVPAAVASAAELPAGEVVVLSVLRNRVARMQQLVADHSSASAQLAADIRDMGYR